MTEQAFKAVIASIEDERLRERIEHDAHVNSFAVETYDEYGSDDERWRVAVATAKMMLDDVSSYYPDLF